MQTEQEFLNEVGDGLVELRSTMRRLVVENTTLKAEMRGLADVLEEDGNHPLTVAAIRALLARIGGAL